MQENLTADLVIIGAGIAGAAIAFRAGGLGLKAVVLDDGRNGATHAATGFLAPRIDYMLRDIDLVQMSDVQCQRFINIFGETITPKMFHVPIDPKQGRLFKWFESLLEAYDSLTPIRRKYVPGFSKLSKIEFETNEPNIRRDKFEGAYCLWELTADPDRLLRNLLSKSDCIRIPIQRGSLRFDSSLTGISGVIAKSFDGNNFEITGSRGRKIVVINAAGPWAGDIAGQLNVGLGIEFRLGIQAAIPGNFLNSGLITLSEGGGYTVYFPKEGYIQAGPTNTKFTGRPDDYYTVRDNLNTLIEGFKNIIDPNVGISGYGFLKSGLRVKPLFGDTNRPIIWSHKVNGINNFYSIVPGKMIMALAAADDLLKMISDDGWFNFKVTINTGLSLDGNKYLKNNLLLNINRAKSLATVSKKILINYS